MEKIHIRNMFRLLVPLNENLGSAVTRTEPFGIDMVDFRCSFNIKLVATDHFGNIKHEPKNCFTWAKRNPLIYSEDSENSVNGLFIRLKINQGVFDFRRTKDRMFQVIIEYFENGNLVKAGTSRIWELFPKRRHVQSDDEENESK